MDISLLIILALVFCLLFPLLKQRWGSKWGRGQRELFIRDYAFSDELSRTILKQHPELNNAQAERIIEGLREYFQICLSYRCKNVGMPSKLVDLAWHEFILCTREYHEFCEHAFGKYLHHTPNRNDTSEKTKDRALARTWKMSCLRESLNPKHPAKLPLLFAIDSTFGVDDAHLNLLTAPNKFNGKGHSSNTGGCGGGWSGSKFSGGDADGGGCGGGCGGG